MPRAARWIAATRRLLASLSRPDFMFQASNVFLSLGVYRRLDGFGETQAVNDPYGKLWVRAIVGVDL